MFHLARRTVLLLYWSISSILILGSSCFVENKMLMIYQTSMYLV